MHNNKYILKNFRVFDNEGAKFDIAPITIITGQNSSGKSSVFKSLMLLSNTLMKVKKNFDENSAYDPNTIKLEFHEGKHNLGTYDKTINRYSENKDISLSYGLFSDFLQDEITIEMIFGHSPSDFLKSAKLKQLNILNKNTSIASLKTSEDNDAVTFTCDTNRLIPHFERFIISRENHYKPTNNFLTESGKTDNPINFKDIDEKSFLNLENKIPSFIDVEKLFENNPDIRYDGKLMLFYLPIVKYFDAYKRDELKDRFNQLILENIESERLKHDYCQDTLKAINHYLDIFLDSEFNSLSDFYIYHERKYVSEHYNDVNLSRILAILGSVRTNPSKSIDYLNALKDYLSLNKSPNGSFIEINESGKIDKIISKKEVDFLEMFSKLVDFFYYIGYDHGKNRIQSVSDWDLMQNGYYYEYYVAIEFEDFNNFISGILQESFLSFPSFISNNTFVDAIRTNTQRLHTFKGQGSDFNKLMVEYLSFKNQNNKRNNNYILGEFTKEWIKRFDIADDIMFELSEDGLGVHIYTIRSNEKTLLADEGFGISQLLSILLQIEINAIISLVPKSNELEVTQTNRYNESTISIEEPEANLHPKFQSLLADLFIDAYKKFNIKFMIETHSEYLIRKIQTLISKKDITSNYVAIHYIYHPLKDKRPSDVNHVEKINILDDGRLDKSFGSGFFDEADNLAMDLLNLKFFN